MFAPQCVDADGDATTVTMGPGDTCGGAFTQGRYEWEPSELQGGTTCRLAVICSDGTNSASFDRTITVLEANIAPQILNLPASVQARWGRSGEFEPALTDADLPPQSLGLSVSSTTCSFPVQANATRITFTCGAATEVCSADISASDGTSSTSGRLDITCTNVRPSFTSTPSGAGAEQVEYTYEIECGDTDGDAVSLAVSSDDSCGGDIVDGTYRVLFPETPGSGGTCQLSVTCSDQLATEKQTATVQINERQSPPTFDNLPATMSIHWSDAGTFDVKASDIDRPSPALVYTIDSATCSFPLSMGPSGHVSFSCPGEEECKATMAVKDDGPKVTSELSIHCQNASPSIEPQQAQSSISRYDKYSIPISCEDEDDTATLTVAATDTCNGVLRGDTYWFVPDETYEHSCMMAVSCTDGAAPTSMTQLIDVTPGTQTVNGSLRQLAMGDDGEILYFGGAFDGIARPLGNVVALDESNGTVDFGWPRIEDGQAYAVKSDGAGGFFIGGSFSHVDGYPIANLAHVRSDGALDQTFHPALDGAVYRIAVDGSDLIVGGWFSNVEGEGRDRVAMLSTAGALRPFRSELGGYVTAFIFDGGDVYVAGELSKSGGPTIWLVKLDRVTGADSGWQTPVRSRVSDMAIDGDILYLVGENSLVSGPEGQRASTAAFSLSTGSLTAWQVAKAANLETIMIRDHVIYLGGSFDWTFGSAERQNAAAVSPAGTLMSWNPSPNDWVYSLSSSGKGIYLAGRFTLLGAQPRNGAGLTDPIFGQVLPFTMPVTKVGGVYADSGKLLLSGEGIGTAESAAENLGAITVEDGAAVDWHPRVDGPVRAVATAGNMLAIGGFFTAVNGVPRAGLASFVEGILTTWSPSLDNSVTSIAISTDAIYVAGAFSEIDGEARPGLAAFDRTTGGMLPWSPQVNGGIYQVLVDGGRLFVAGDFDTIDGLTRNQVAAFDVHSGDLVDWYVEGTIVGSEVEAIASSSTTLFVGGYFPGIGDREFKNLAQLYAATGRSTEWHPTEDLSEVRALAFHGTTVFVGGEILDPAGVQQPVAWAFDATTAQRRAWASSMNDYPLSIVATPNQVFLGGGFSVVNGRARQGLAALPVP